VREQANTRFERCHLKSLGESCWNSKLLLRQRPELNPPMDLQQVVIFRIIDEFRRRGIESRSHAPRRPRSLTAMLHIVPV